MNKKTYVTLLLIITGCSFLIYASSGGITGVTKKEGAGAGCTCHGSSSSGVNVAIAGPDVLAPGQTADYTVTITGGPLSAGGTNIAASAGDLNPSGNGLRKENGELTHTQPKAQTNNSVVFQFTYTAPAEVGTYTIYANGNSVNNNGANTQDQWNFAADKMINVSGTADVDDEQLITKYALRQNYPNPFNPSTNISFRIAEGGFVNLKVFDVLGNEVGTLVNEDRPAGEYTVSFNALNLASGIYYYQLKTKDFAETKKMILAK